jgi:uncharacterized protein
MNYKSQRRIVQVIVGLTALYFLGGLVLYLIQEKIMFHPKAVARDYAYSFDKPFEELNIPFENKNLSILKFGTKVERRGIVLFFHGNMNNAEHYKKYCDFFWRNDYELWMIDYPGFGKTTGKRSEQIMYAQALLMYSLARKEISEDSIVIYGKSIGTGVAAYVAANKTCRRLILETPYYNLRSLAGYYFPIYPAGALMKYSFPLNIYLKNSKAPVTILHGTHDDIVPYQQAKRLKKENPGIHLITIDNGEHNNLSDFSLFHSTLDSLLR